MKELGVIDQIIPEPDGGAHHDHDAASALLDTVLQSNMTSLKGKAVPELLEARYTKFRQMAQFFTE